MSRRIALLASAAVLLGAAPPPTVEYFLINGPEYREVSRAVFDDYRSSCSRIDVRSYPDDTVEIHCYL